MIMKALWTVLLALALPILGSIGTPGFCQAEPIQTHLARRIIGRTVENYDGDRLGTVKDFVVEMRSGQVEYAIISSGGVASFGSILKPVPPQAVSLATAKKRTVALGGSKFRWEKAPTITRRELASLSAPSRMRAIYDFYGQQPAGVVMAQVTKAPGDPAPLSRTGVENSPAALLSTADPLQLSSELIGLTVVNRQQEKIGKIADLLIDLSRQKPVYAIILAKFSETERSFAVPLTLLSLPVGNRIVIDANRSQFEQAQPFDQKIWQPASLSPSGIYLFPDRDVDNTRRNERGTEKRTLSPFDQSESKTDRRLTQQIRQALVKDSLLSVTARNIKIITVHGRVTLRGPVRREQEKEEIARQAAHIAGAQNVENQIEIEGK